LGAISHRGGEDPTVQAAYADSPWKVSLRGTAALASGELLKPGPHRLEVWIQPNSCGVHAVTVFFREDGQWNLEVAAERAECLYGGTLAIKSAWINGRQMKPVRERYEWRVLGDPIEWVFQDD
jgi:hypothetical protein